MASLAGRLPSPPRTSAFSGVVAANDVFEVMLADDVGNVTFEPCVVWNVMDTGFEVFFLHRSQTDQLVWEYGEVQFIEWQSVNLHLSLSEYEGTTEERQKRAFRRLGFRFLGDGKFYKISEENAVAQALPQREALVGLIDTSDEDTEVDSDEELEDCELESLDSDGNLKDLVSKDEDCELWTPAEGAFAEETHQAAARFDAHAPTNDRQLRVKDAFGNLEGRIKRAERERAWQQGR